MKPTKKRIEAEIRKLRRLIDSEATGRRVGRAAYMMEIALRWTVEDTVGWNLTALARGEEEKP